MPGAVGEVLQRVLRDMQQQWQYLENPVLAVTCAVVCHWHDG